MRRKWLLASVAGVGLVLAVLAWLTSSTGAQDQTNGNGKKALDGPLPIRQVVLFNSGVGYFQREGDVEGNAQVDLSFSAADINDLLKSLILQDLGGGKVSTVSYDSHDPIDKILRSFALDLNGNPTFGQILNQARGERVELLVKSDKKDAAPTKVQGVIVGMENKRRPIGKDTLQVVDMDTLNLSGPSGLQAVNLEEVLGVRFLNATLESEFQRALRVLASVHDTQKKTVSLGFNGPGKRAVRVGYVVDQPIWKTSYRLRVEPNGKIFLQGWALVENTSDNDWNNVRMVLVSGRPISFEMNLYEPIYMPRPFVEPEMFASLRPPVYAGALEYDEKGNARVGRQQQPFNPSAIAGGFANPFGGGIGMAGGGVGQGGFGGGAAGAAPPTPVSQGGPADIRRGVPSGFGGGGFAGGFAGGQVSGSFQGSFQGGGGFQGFGGVQNMNPYQGNPRGDFSIVQNRLTYEELQRRREQEAQAKDDAQKKGPAITGLNFKEGIASVASASEIGDHYQYLIDQKITLSRQKSAMLPILDQFIDGAKVSIYNPDTHAQHPLLGLRLKNTSGQPLTQGPITVYDNNTYAGDTRILDVQPGEERLLSYALDLGTEIKTEVKTTISPEMHLRLGEPALTARYKLRQTKTYTIKNRSAHDRSVILEHPIRGDWKLADAKPGEKTRSHYRFTVPAATGKTVRFDVVEEQDRVDSIAAINDRVPFYAIQEGLHVKQLAHASEEKLTSLRIHQGWLFPTLKVRESRSYHIQNLSDQDRVFTIDHVIRKDWSRIDPKGDAQPGPDVFRFELKTAKGKTATREIVEERVYTDKRQAVSDLGAAKLKEYLAHPAVGADVKAGLTKATAMHATWTEAARQLAGLDATLKTVSDDQARLRENLRIIPQTAEAYKRFLDKFVAQETEIENLQKNIRLAQATVAAAQRDHAAFIANLTAE